VNVKEFATFTYRVLGERINFLYPYFEEYKLILRKANIKISFEAYISTLTFISIFTFTFSLLPAYLILISIPTMNIAYKILLPIGIAVLTGLLTFLTLYFYPYYRIDNRRRNIDNSMPYIASFMAILAKAGASIGDIFRELSKIERPKEISEEASEIIRDVEVFGKDLITAVEKRAGETPSEYLAEVLLGISTMIRIGGNLEAYLIDEAERFITIRRTLIREVNSILSSLTEIYVIMALVMPMLLIVISTIISMMGGIIFGLNAKIIIEILTFILTPTIFLTFTIIIDTIMTED